MSRLPPAHMNAAKAASPRGRLPSLKPHVPRPPWAPVQLRAKDAPSPAPAATPNRTGLPDRLKAGIEALSGMAMDDVRVHRNSSEPAKLGALAYAKGSDIHLGPGQERHLPHEAWHVVQQKQGRVRATRQLDRLALNDAPALEREADATATTLASVNQTEFAPKRRALLFPSGSPAQRKISTRQGPELPAKGDAVALAPLFADGQTYLVGTRQDLRTLRAGTAGDLSILTPKRHIIGEDHTKSKYASISAEWSWRAQTMYEADTDHPRLPNPALGGRLALEDTIAKYLGALLLDSWEEWQYERARKEAAEGLEAAGRLSAQRVFDYSKNIEMHLERAQIHVQYGIDVHHDLVRYTHGAAELAQQPGFEQVTEALGVVNAVGLATLTTALAHIAERQIGRQKIAELTGAALAELFRSIDLTAARRYLDDMSEALKAIVVFEQRDRPDLHSAIDDKFESVGPLREFHMANRIKARPTDVPLLVGVGALHLAGLRAAQIPDAEFHPDHTVFTDHIKAARLLPNLEPPENSCCVIS